MTTSLREAAQRALAALNALHQWHVDYDDFGGYDDSSLYHQNYSARHALETALAAPPVQAEPAAIDELVRAAMYVQSFGPLAESLRRLNLAVDRVKAERRSQSPRVGEA